MKGNPLVFHGISNAKYESNVITVGYGMVSVSVNEPNEPALT